MIYAIQKEMLCESKQAEKEVYPSCEGRASLYIPDENQAKKSPDSGNPQDTIGCSGCLRLSSSTLLPQHGDKYAQRQQCTVEHSGAKSI
jgi:hypothetical protein